MKIQQAMESRWRREKSDGWGQVLRVNVRQAWGRQQWGLQKAGLFLHFSPWL